MKSNALTALVLASLLVLSAAPAQAWQQVWHGSPHLMLAKAGMSMDEAVASVKRSTGGRVLSSRRGERNGKAVYIIRVLLPGGRVKDVVINAGGN